MKPGPLAVLCAAVAAAAWGCTGVAGGSDPRFVAPMTVPEYTSDGDLRQPEGFDTWVFAGASVGLGYRDKDARQGPGKIHNVFLQPQAYAHYARTGEFPEKTMLVLALYEPRENESIARQGFFSGDLVAVEVAVKDKATFEDGWAYFDFGAGDVPTAKAFSKEECFDCHRRHAAADNVFVQFYPALRRLHRGKNHES